MGPATAVGRAEVAERRADLHPRSTTGWVTEGVGSTDLSPAPPQPPPRDPRAGALLSAALKGDCQLERRGNTSRSASVAGSAFLTFGERATTTTTTTTTTSLPASSLALVLSLPRPPPLPVHITQRCCRQETDTRQRTGWEGGADRKASSPPPRISYRKEGEKRGGRKGGSNNFTGGGSSGKPLCPSPATHASIYCFNNLPLGCAKSGVSPKWGCAGGSCCPVSASRR